jgi:peroxiredoxin
MMWRNAPVLAGLVLASVVTCCAYSVGDTVADFTLPDDQGGSRSLYDDYGKVILITFWTYDCRDCRIEAVELETDFWQALQDQGFMVLSIGKGQSVEVCGLWRAENQVTYPILSDGDTSVYNLFGDGVVPWNVVLDRQMVIRRTQAGFDSEATMSLILDLLAEGTPEPTVPPSPSPAAPSPTPIPSPTAGPGEEGIWISTNQGSYGAGDLFVLSTRVVTLGAVELDQFVVLDVYGSYWFWPSWGTELDSERRSFPGGELNEELLSFTWPSGAGSATEIRFWAALLRPADGSLYGRYGNCEFSFH